MERSCSQVSVGQYATFSPNTDGFDLQSFARAGSGWDIHMVFNTSNCGVFYDTIYIGKCQFCIDWQNSSDPLLTRSTGKTGVCLNYVIQTSYLSYQSFMFYECDQQYGTSFYNFADFECSGYNMFEQVQANVSTCVVYSSFGSVNYRTTHCNGVATAPFNLTPFSTSNAHNKHLGLYYWRSVLYVIVVYSVLLITL